MFLMDVFLTCVVLGLFDSGVDVACTKKGEPFRGDQASRQHVSLRLVDLIDLAEANDTGKPHWAAAEVNVVSSVYVRVLMSYMVTLMPPSRVVGDEQALQNLR